MQSLPKITPWLIGISIALALGMIVTTLGMTNDEAVWDYMARIWVDDGLPPYTYSVENKPPGVIYLYCLSHCLFGPTPFFVRSLGVLALLATSVTVFKIAKEIAGDLAGNVALCTCGLAMGWTCVDPQITGHTENFMILFSTLPVLLLLRAAKHPQAGFGQMAFCCGILFGVAVNFKQVALFSILGWCAFVCLLPAETLGLKQKLRAPLLVALGAAMALILVAIPVLMAGVGVGDYLDGAWLILLNKTSSNSAATSWESSALAGLVQCVRLRMTGFAWKFVNSRFVMFYPLVLLLVFCRDLLRNRMFLGVLAWAFFEFLGHECLGILLGPSDQAIYPQFGGSCRYYHERSDSPDGTPRNRPEENRDVAAYRTFHPMDALGYARVVQPGGRFQQDPRTRDGSREAVGKLGQKKLPPRRPDISPGLLSAGATAVPGLFRQIVVQQVFGHVVRQQRGGHPDATAGSGNEPADFHYEGPGIPTAHMAR